MWRAPSRSTRTTSGSGSTRSAAARPPRSGIHRNGNAMRYIDAFNHFFPKRFFAGVLETPAAQKDMGKRIRGIPALFDLDERLRSDGYFPHYSHGVWLP